MKQPWGENTPWHKQTNFMSYLRGCLRKAWSNNPIKITVLNKKRRQIKNPNPKGKKEFVWGFDCEMCGNEYAIANGQVDHITPAGSLREISDIQGFVERLLCVTEDDLRLVCKDCNSALAMSDKSGLSFEDSVIEKQVIAICKAKQDKAWLIDRGIKPESNAAKRKMQIRNYLFKQTKEEI